MLSEINSEKGINNKQTDGGGVASRLAGTGNL